jgi:hypothetical protein
VLEEETPGVLEEETPGVFEGETPGVSPNEDENDDEEPNNETQLIACWI